MPEIVTKQQMWKDMFGNETDKKAELAQTYDMPLSMSPNTSKRKPGGDKAVINKTASQVTEEDVLRDAFGSIAKSEDWASYNPTGPLQPHVDVTGSELKKVASERVVELYACPSIRKYPLDGYDQVEKAAAYFDEHGAQMEPAMRREYCSNLVKRASVLNIKVSPEVERYGADTYAPPHQIKIALDARRLLLEDEDDVAVLDKLAQEQPLMSPEFFAATLEEFDKRNLLDHHYGDIPDPYFSTFAKVAAKTQPTESTAPPDDAILIGNEYLSKKELVEFSKHNNEDMESRFGEDMAKEFAKDPMGIFNSLPRDQKLIIMRMANSSDSQTFGASTS